MISGSVVRGMSKEVGLSAHAAGTAISFSSRSRAHDAHETSFQRVVQLMSARSRLLGPLERIPRWGWAWSERRR